jgi:hypothetical protein
LHPAYAAMLNNRRWSIRRPACCCDVQQQAMVQQASRLLLCRIVLIASRLLLCRIVLVVSRLLLERKVLVASRLCSNAQQQAMVQQASRLLLCRIVLLASRLCSNAQQPAMVQQASRLLQRCSTTGNGPTGVPPVAAMLNNRRDACWTLGTRFHVGPLTPGSFRGGQKGSAILPYGPIPDAHAPYEPCCAFGLAVDGRLRPVL